MHTIKVLSYEVAPKELNFASITKNIQTMRAQELMREIRQQNHIFSPLRSLHAKTFIFLEILAKLSSLCGA